MAVQQVILTTEPFLQFRLPLFLFYKGAFEVLTFCTNMSKAVFLLTMSANKPDAAFYHQRNCLAGILKNKKEI